jgi:tRNA(Ser,Leu) C12 N-acetylase TAN1
MQRPQDAPAWNVIVTTESGRRRFRTAFDGLRRLGAFWTVPFKGVCVGHVADVPAFLEALRGAKARGEPWALAVARAIPVERSFAFTPETFREQLKAAVAPLAARIGPGPFHFRLERRGLAGQVASDVIEREIADHVFSLAAAHGAALQTSFSDADTVLAAETVGDECGVALLPRALRERFPFVATR